MANWTEDKIEKLAYAKKGKRKRISVDRNLVLYVTATQKYFKVRYNDKNDRAKDEPIGSFISADEKMKAQALMTNSEFETYCRINTTFDDAKIFKMQKLKSLQNGTYVRPVAPAPAPVPVLKETTFAEYVKTWKTKQLYAVAKNGTEKYKATTRKAIETRLSAHIEKAPFWNWSLRAIKPMDIIAYVNGIEKIPTAQKVASIISTILESAHKNGEITDNPMPAKIFSENIEASAYTSTPQAAVTSDLSEFCHIVAAVNDYRDTNLITGGGLLFLAYNFCRPVEMRFLRWRDIDWEKRLILLPAEITKIKKEVLIPYSTQTERLLRQIQYEYPKAKPEHFVFRSKKSGAIPISDATPGAALDKIEARYELTQNAQTAHGFRACACTYLQQQPFSFPKQLVEKQLSHVLGDVERCYNRAEFLEERREMLQTWSDYLEQNAPVVIAKPITRKRSKKSELPKAA